MEEACVPVVFRQKSCAYRDFWRFSIEILPLDRRSNAESEDLKRISELRSSMKILYRYHLNSIQRIGSVS